MDTNIYNLEGKDVIGRDGTKTIYLIDEKLCVAVPNKLDGKALIDRWPRITKEEQEISQLLQKLGVPALTFTECKVRWFDAKLTTISSRPFSDYVRENIYIIDTKNIKSTQWPKDYSLTLIVGDKHDITIGSKLFNLQLMILSANNICLPKDALNLAYVGKGSNLHSGSKLPFEIRLWCFDLTSKWNNANIFIEPLPLYAKLNMLSHIVEYGVWNGLAPNKICLSTKDNRVWK